MEKEATKPLNVGERVWFDNHGGSVTQHTIIDIDDELGLVRIDSSVVGYAGEAGWTHPMWVTHEHPDAPN